jgi:hypothetical protein
MLQPPPRQVGESKNVIVVISVRKRLKNYATSCCIATLADLTTILETRSTKNRGSDAVSITILDTLKKRRSSGLPTNIPSLCTYLYLHYIKIHDDTGQ